MKRESGSPSPPHRAFLPPNCLHTTDDYCVIYYSTASVDIETDEKIQTTIRREFQGKVLIAIAHRLRTIIGWDRILVMDKGEVADFDTPLNLYDKGAELSIFRSLCEGSHISRAEIERAQIGVRRESAATTAITEV